MSISVLYHTQGVTGFQFQSWKYEGKKAIASIRQKSDKQFCTTCFSHNVTPVYLKDREIRGLPMGTKQLVLSVAVHRLKCRDCGSYRQEQLPFTSGPKARITKSLERTIIGLRPEMSISALSKYLGLSWDTVKDVEKRHLKKKYKRIRLKDVQVLGIDEIHVSSTAKEKFLTIVRDLQSGAVLHVGKGKGGDALDKFATRLKKSKPKIKAIAMDLGPAYAAWAKENCSEAQIVYDHFHVIQLMNNKVDTLRKSIMSKADDELKQKLKNKRFLLLQNEENRTEDAVKDLEELKGTFADLDTTMFMRDSLRRIYSLAPDSKMARMAFEYWCELANASDVSVLKTMAKTITRRLDGIVAFWDNNRITNAAMEGFNNKIRWLIKQAYGYRDEEYFHLKIYDLPTLKTTRDL